MNSWSNREVAGVRRRGYGTRMTAATTLVMVILFACLTNGNVVHNRKSVRGHTPTVSPSGSNYKINTVNLDVVLIFDTTHSFADQLKNMRKSTKSFFERLKTLYPNARLGIAGFRDKPYPPFGGEYDYCFKKFVDLTTTQSRFAESTLNNFLIGSGGGDMPENPLEALLGLFKQKNLGWRKPSNGDNPDNYRRIVIVLTDADYHVYGDVAQSISKNKISEEKLAELLPHFNEKENAAEAASLPPSDGSVWGCTNLEYPKIEDVSAVLKKNNVDPIFAVKQSGAEAYTDLVKKLGKGYVAFPDFRVRDYYNQLLGTIYNVVQPSPEAAETTKAVHVPNIENVKVHKVEEEIVTPISVVPIVHPSSEQHVVEKTEAHGTEKAGVEESTVVEPEPVLPAEAKEHSHEAEERPGEVTGEEEKPGEVTGEEERPEEVTEEEKKPEKVTEEEKRPEEVEAEEERPVPVHEDREEAAENVPREKEETRYEPAAKVEEQPTTVVNPKEAEEKGYSKEKVAILTTTSTKRLIPVPSKPLLPAAEDTEKQIAKKSKSNKYKYLVPAAVAAGVGLAGALGYGIKHWKEGKQEPNIINPPTATPPIFPPFTPPEENPVPPFVPPENPEEPGVLPFVPPEKHEEPEVPPEEPEIPPDVFPMPTELPFIRPVVPPVVPPVGPPVVPPVGPPVVPPVGPPVVPPVIPPFGPPVVPPGPEPSPDGEGEQTPSGGKGSNTIVIASATAGAVGLLGAGSYLAYRYRLGEPVEGIEGHFDDEEVEGLTEGEKREAVAATDVSAYA